MLRTLIPKDRDTAKSIESTGDAQESLAYLVHDMRSAATSISLMVDLLELAAKAGDDAVQRARAVSAQNSCQQMAMLCVEAEKHVVGTNSEQAISGTTDLHDVLNELEATYSPLFDLIGKSLKLDIKSIEAKANGDRPQIYRAISNLIDNALKHTSKGASVVLTCSKEHGKVTVSVSDDGPGIDNLDARCVKQINTLPVVQNHILSSGAVFSAGTGLRYVAETMKSLDGDSTVETNAFGGSTFRLMFPKR